MRRVWLFAAIAIILAGPVVVNAQVLPSTTEAQDWSTDFASSLARAKQQEKPLLIHFYAEWSTPCRRMEREVLHSTEVLRHVGQSVVGVQVKAAGHPDLIERYDIRALPSDVLVAPDGEDVLWHSAGYQSKAEYGRRLNRAILGEVSPGGASQTASRDDSAKASSSAKHSGPGSQQPEASVAASAKSTAQSSGSDPQADQPTSGGDERIGLNGYSPVSLWQWHEWRRGKARFAHRYRGTVYRMATDRELRKFQADPQRYVPQLDGCDPVLLKTSGRARPGSPRFGAYYNNRLYLFVSAETRKRFKSAPKQFLPAREASDSWQGQAGKLR